MDKEFNALEWLDFEIRNQKEVIEDYKEENKKYGFGINKDIIAFFENELKKLESTKQALLELKQIKEAKPSEAMKCLEVINNYGCGLNDNMKFSDVLTKEHDTIKQALQRLQVMDKAIEICKKANEQKFVYIKESYGIIKEDTFDNLDYEVLNNRLYVNSRGMYYEFYLKDYGTLWALTKEELK